MLANADDLIRRFKYEDYPQVAVSVDMLSTGFDCREVLHLVMCCRIRSPILYQQVRGRGTRVAPHIGKQRFMIYDFFRNHQHFNDSDEDFFAGTGRGSSSGGSGGGPRSPRELIELGIGDRWKEAVQYVEIGNEGEQLDKRRYVTIWKETINNQVSEDLILQKIRLGEFLTEEEENQIEQQLNQPKYYFNEENLRRAYNNPQSNLIDFIKAALKLIKIKSIAEQKEENFRAWLII